MNRISTKRRRELAQYAKLKREFLREHDKCFACGKPVLLEERVLHHFFKRRGELLCFVPGFRMADDTCHFLIHLDEKSARAANLLAPKECCDDYARAVAWAERNK